MAQLGRTERSRRIRRFLLEAVRNGHAGFISDAASRFGISRQSIHRHIASLVESGYLIAKGLAGRRTYRLGPVREHCQTYTLGAVDESTAYRRDFAFIFDDLPKNVENICYYGFTEMVNNAIDHSEGTTVEIDVDRNEEEITLTVCDDGEGIFRRIARILELADPREAMFELYKGKLTTAPLEHTGQGIFFSSKMFDTFAIASGDLVFLNLDRGEHDPGTEILDRREVDERGTAVLMAIAIDSEQTTKEVFDAFTTGEDYQFDKTTVPVRMALYEGETLISRSQAKRILSRVERFRIVMLDFEGVTELGHSFVDETFRVWQRAHPKTKLHVVNVSDRIEAMIEAKRREIADDLKH